MTEQPEEPRKKPDPWAGLFPTYLTGARRAPDSFSFDRQKGDLAGAGLTEAQLAALGVPPKPAERLPVELSAERRAHIARFAAEFREWVEGGLTRNEALGVVAMEIQLEARYKHLGEGS